MLKIQAVPSSVRRLSLTGTLYPHGRATIPNLHAMMDGGMMWGMGIGWILIAVLVVLGIAALAKYLFSMPKT